MGQELIITLKDYISRNWNNRQSLSFLFIFIIVGIGFGLATVLAIQFLISTIGIPLDGIIEKYKLSGILWIIKFSLVITTTTVLIFYWIKGRYLPKLKEGEVGIYLVPLFKDDEKIQSLNSFIKKFKCDLEDEIGDIADIKSLTCPYYYHIIQNLIKDHEEAVRKGPKSRVEKISKKFDELRNKYNVNYILLFECNDRVDGGEGIIQISKIRQVVIHASTHYYNQEILKKDLTLSMPSGFNINSNNEQSEIKNLMHLIGPHIAYIIAVTHFLKKDYLKCIENANKAMFTRGLKTKVYERASSITSQAYIEIADELIKEMYRLGEFTRIEDYLNSISNASKFRHSSYSIALMLGIGYFLRDFNTIESRRIIKKGIGAQATGEEWMVSLAFLDLWDKKYTDALNKIKSIKWDILSNPVLLNGILQFNDGVNKKHYRIELDFWSAVVSKKMGNQASFGYYRDKIKIEELNPSLKQYLESID